MKGIKQPWNQAQIDFIMKNYQTMYKPDVLKEINKLGTEHTYASLQVFYHKHNLCNGFDCRFKKGRVAPNKGKKMNPEVYEKVKHTFFQKGNKPSNYKPLGTERLVPEKGGKDRFYIQVKTSDHNGWTNKHHLVWEEHYGPIPKGHRIIFLDGNSLNCDINNLRMVSLSELLQLNQKYADFNSIEEREVFLDLVKINAALRKQKKNETNIGD